jgi:CDP-L-myo-inositol myo-inositolphosphotransferase
VLAAEKMIKKNRKFILMMSDHLIESNVIKAVVESGERCPLLTVERNLDKVLEIEDATKVFIDNEGIRSIGKDIKTFNGVDIGLFLLDRSIFYFLKESIGKGDDSLTAGIREMIEKEKLHIYSIPEESYWIDVDSVNSYNSAKQIWRKR